MTTNVKNIIGFSCMRRTPEEIIHRKFLREIDRRESGILKLNRDFYVRLKGSVKAEQDFGYSRSDIGYYFCIIDIIARYKN